VFGGDPTGFFGRPISAVLLVVFVLVAVLPAIRSAAAKRKASTPAVPAASEIKEKV
jgi:putative tricarboxylic transport membrane protein